MSEFGALRAADEAAAAAAAAVGGDALKIREVSGTGNNVGLVAYDGESD
jgi:hypothetical protein